MKISMHRNIDLFHMLGLVLLLSEMKCRKPGPVMSRKVAVSSLLLKTLTVHLGELLDSSVTLHALTLKVSRNFCNAAVECSL